MDTSDRLHADLLDLNALENIAAANLDAVRRAKDGVKARMANLDPAMRPVSEHAVLRYLERIVGMDLDQVRHDIRAMVHASVPAEKGDYRIHPDGTCFVISADGLVVTVLDAATAARPVGNRKIILVTTEGDAQ